MKLAPMKLMIAAALAALALGMSFPATSASAGGITACVHARTQIGDGSIANVTQNCQSNMNGTMQAGNNTSTNVKQKGAHNDSTSIQIGDGGMVRVSQHGGDNGVGVLQNGNKNKARVKQGF